MTTEFDDVFAGKGVRGFEVGYERPVQNLTASRVMECLERDTIDFGHEVAITKKHSGEG